MIRAGVTGGIGTGKSTLCDEWEKLGAKIVNADNLARELMVTDSGVRMKLTETFGPETYNSDGSLNKPHLIREAFDNKRVEELNEIVHPAVARKFHEICERAEMEGETMIVEEAALLLNTGRPSGFDAIILVTLPPEKQVKRVTKRDSASEQEVLARMNNQPDFSKLTHLADYVIENNGTEVEFRLNARQLYKDILREYNGQ